MVLGIITSIAACPAIIGVTEAVRQGQSQNKRQRQRGSKSNLQVSCTDPSRKARDIHGGYVVLRDNKLYVTTVNPKAKFSHCVEEKDANDPSRLNQAGHLFAGYFFPFPDIKWSGKGDGFVTTIADDPPQLNWVYVDIETFEIKYGLKKDVEGHLVGPWNCTPIDKRLTFDGWEGFMVVEVEKGLWQLYYDVNDDGLEDVVPPEQRIMEVELTRKEMRMQKGDSIFG